MKATGQQQETLLELGQIDLQIRRNQLAMDAIVNSDKIEECRTRMLALSEALLSARNLSDSLKIELSRAEQDLALVEDRIQRDKSRLEQSSNPKDIQGIQHELASLGKRKDTLEDAELVLIEKFEIANSEAERIQNDREAVQAELAAIEAEQSGEIAKLKSGAMLLTEDRIRAIANIPDELADHYEKLHAKKIGVGRFSGISCGVCGMTLSGSNLDEIRATPMDELAHCGECGGILVR